jgi:hypothetical protein
MQMLCNVGFPYAAWKYEYWDMRPTKLQPFCGMHDNAVSIWTVQQRMVKWIWKDVEESVVD